MYIFAKKKRTIHKYLGNGIQVGYIVKSGKVVRTIDIYVIFSRMALSSADYFLCWHSIRDNLEGDDMPLLLLRQKDHVKMGVYSPNKSTIQIILTNYLVGL